VGPRAGLDAVVKRKIPSPPPGIRNMSPSDYIDFTRLSVLLKWKKVLKRIFRCNKGLEKITS
jgi:hypothetical protein